MTPTPVHSGPVAHGCPMMRGGASEPNGPVAIGDDHGHFVTTEHKVPYGEMLNNHHQPPYLANQCRNSMSISNTKGLLNMPGQNNCFLNSAVQVLWHLDIFRRSFRELTGHACMADSCIFCALKELFAQFQYSRETALPPDALRRALAETFFDQRRFQLGFMDDAAECFENILLRIHCHIASQESEDMCSAGHCIPHQKFAMTLVEQTVCHACGATSEPLPFTQMVHYVSASALCTQARLSKERGGVEMPKAFGNLMKTAGGMGDVRDCPSSCGAKIQIQKTLMNNPEILSVGLVWDSERPNLDHIMEVFDTIGLTIQLQDVFHSVVDKSWANATVHNLVGVVTYYGKHYSTFFFHSKLGVWIYFDDAAVREIGPRWEQVVEKCRRGHFQPLLLLYADPNGTPVSVGSAPSSITYIPGQKKIPGPCLVTDHLKGRLNRAGTPSDVLTSGLTPTPQITYLTSNSDLVEQAGSQGSFEENCTCRNDHRSYEECDIHGTYISRKAVEHVLNFQKLQRQRSLNGSITSGHGSVGSRNSSSSLESFENNNSVHQQQQIPQPKSSLLAMVDIKAKHQGPNPSVAMSLNFARRRDSGNWSGDRNSASSASSTSLDNPYVFLPGRRHAYHGGLGGPIAKSRLQDPNLMLSDQGYDSFSLSSTDSYPSIGNGSPLKIDNRLGQILENVQLDLPNGASSKHSAENAGSSNKVHIHNCLEDCDKLCAEADLLLNKSNEKEQEGDLAMAALYSDAAAAKARQAMDAPYNNNQSMVSAKMKHSLCVMRSSNIHRRIKEAETEERRRLKEQQSGLESHHHRQSSRDSTHSRHSRQSSKDSTHSQKQLNSPKNSTSRSGSIENFEKLGNSIEIYATLPKKGSKKKSSSFEDVLCKNFDDTTFLNKKDEMIIRKEVPVASPQTPTPTRYTMNNELSNYFYSKDTPELLGDYWTRQDVVIPQPRLQNSLSRTLSGPANLKDSPELSKETNSLSSKKQHKIRRKLMGGLMRRKNRSLPDLREGQDQNEGGKSSAYDDTELVLGLRSTKTKENKLENISTSANSDYLSEDNSYVSRGFHQPHRAFVNRDFYQRPLLMKVSPPKVDEKDRFNVSMAQPEMYKVQPPSESSYQTSKPLVDHPEVIFQNKQMAHIQSLRQRSLLDEGRKNLASPIIHTQTNYYTNGQTPPYQTLTSPVVERRTGLASRKMRETNCEIQLKPANVLGCSSNSPNWGQEGQSCLSSRKAYSTSSEELPVANSSFLAELQAKRSQILDSNGTNSISQTNKVNVSNNSKGNWLEELQKKQQQIQLTKREIDSRAGREDSKSTLPMSAPTTLRCSSVSSPQKVLLQKGLDSPDGNYSSHQTIPNASSFHKPQIKPGTSEENQSKTVKDLASRFEHILYTKPVPNQSNDVVNNQLSDVNEKTNHYLNPAHTEMTTMAPGRLFTVTSSMAQFGASSPQNSYSEMMEIRAVPQSSNGLRLDSSPITTQLPGYKLSSSPQEGDVRRPQKPPDYETAIQRLGLIRDIRSASPMENGLNKLPYEPQNAVQQEAIKKIRGPKKSVTFSDQVVLVACADDQESDFLPNPLLERVYKQHGMRTDTEIIDANNRVTIPNTGSYQIVVKEDAEDKVLCNLCHQQRVPAQAVYCTDCSFYMARFSPKK